MSQNHLKLKRKRAWIALAVVLASAVASVGPARAEQPLSPAPAGSGARFNYLDKTLPNGLRVVALEDFGTPIVAVQVWYHVGSKNENPQRQGFAHMFEHMMFRGTDRLGPKEHFEAIRRVGGDCNAYTAFDQTVYVEKLPSNQLDLAMYLESERLAFLKIDQTSFDTERSVVEEERRQGLNAPYGTVLERVLPQVFKQHPYKWTPIGQIPHLRSASATELARFWETYYVPNNATLVVVGAVKKEEVLEKAEKYFGWIPTGAPAPTVDIREPEQAEPREIKITEPKGPLTIVVQGYRTVPMSHPDAVPLDILCSILGGGESSRLYQLLVKEKDLAIAAEGEQYNLEQDGLLGLGAVLKPMGGDKKDEVLKLVNDEIEKVKADGVTEEELEKAKLNMLKGQVGQAQTAEERAKLLGTYAVLYGDLARVNSRFDEIRAVKLDDIKRVANTYFTASRKNVVFVEPGGLGEMLKAAAVPKGQEEGPPAAKVEGNPVIEKQGPKATAARPANFPATAPVAKVFDTFPEVDKTERTLGNGLKVVVVPKHQTPLVTFQLGIKAGSGSEPAEKAGHASMAASLVTQGTENYDSRALAELLERHAISLGAGVGTDNGSVTASCLTEQADLTVKLLAEVVLRPTFPEKEFVQARDQALAGLAMSEQNPKYLADRELNKELFGEHPYGRSASAAQLKRLTRDESAAWWKSHVRPDNSVLYVAGDLAPDQAFALAEKYLGEWKASGEVPAAPVARIPERKETTIYLIDKPGLVQSEIRMGQIAINRSDPRWPAARVLTQIFGGQFGSRLMESVRIKKGLTYGIYGYFRPEKDAGTLLITTFSKTPTTAETVKASLEEMVRMKVDPPTPEEMSTAKNFLIGSFAGQRETPQAIIGDLWMLESTGLPADYLRTMLAGVARTEESNVRQLANDLMDEKQLAIVVVGDASKVRTELEKLGKVVLVTPEGKAPTTQP